MTVDASVLVIGSGLSGLAAARELQHQGYTVKVIEARDRVGGRVLTHKTSNDAFIDVGASFIHGVDGNPITTVAEDLGLTLVPFEQCILYDAKGWAVEKALDGKIEKNFNDTLESCHQAAQRVVQQLEASSAKAQSTGAPVIECSTPESSSRCLNKQLEEAAVSDGCLHSSDKTGNLHAGGDGCSVTPAPAGTTNAFPLIRPWSEVPARLDEMVEATCGSMLATLSTEEKRLFQWHRSNLEIACGADLSELSSLHWNHDDQYTFEGDHSMIAEGYGTLAEAVAETLDISFNCEVKSIRVDVWSGRVTVVTADGTSHEADFVICTLPLGVLKSRSVSFYPPLSQKKMESIHNVGFGCLNKIVLSFSHVFWDTVDFIGHAAETRGHFVLFADLSRMSTKPCLVAMVGGSFSSSLEKLTDNAIVQRIMTVLRRIYRHAPDPVATEVSRWRSDKYARGTFSFMTPDSSPADYHVLAEPINDIRGVPRLLFAGEATSLHHPSTTTGAWLSGVREAYRIDMSQRPWKHNEPFDPEVLYETSIQFPRLKSFNGVARRRPPSTPERGRHTHSKHSASSADAHSGYRKRVFGSLRATVGGSTSMPLNGIHSGGQHNIIQHERDLSPLPPVGAKVEVLSPLDGTYYPAVVSALLRDRLVVRYDAGGTESLQRSRRVRLIRADRRSSKRKMYDGPFTA